uniref:SOS response-associated peptidase n=1 Tax=Pararhizobium sp. IMCC3301 TaxID=3067904 RepID=UPI00274168F7|nr:SOS response-associated peptidase [Pararhizobium sp. IMCC3301]
MCGRFTLTHPNEAVAALFDYHQEDRAAEDFPPRYNIAPTQPIATIRVEQARRVLRLVRWGLVPEWVKEPQTFSLLINARTETVLEKPSFRGSIRHHRCLVPASGYFEWRRDGERKQPYYIRPRHHGVFAMAGLWAEWSGPDGNLIDSGALLTQAANQTLSKIHHRMPVVLPAEHFDEWLDVTHVDSKQAHKLLHPVSDDFFEAVPVSTRVNSVRNDDPELVSEIVMENPQKPEPAAPASQMDLF